MMIGKLQQIINKRFSSPRKMVAIVRFHNQLENASRTHCLEILPSTIKENYMTPANFMTVSAVSPGNVSKDYKQNRNTLTLKRIDLNHHGESELRISNEERYEIPEAWVFGG
jgi:hypothetical protein